MPAPRADLENQDEKLTSEARKIADAVRTLPATGPQPPHALVVGGFVRDALLGRRAPDLDLEVYGVESERLQTFLEDLYPGHVNAVGRSFGVLKIHLDDGTEFDVTVPRRESKTGAGHRGFTVTGDPSMPIEEAARRRDFTVNAMAFDPQTNEVLDPWNGRTDLEAKRLRMVDPDTFQDDPLRVYRAIQLAARLGFTVETDTMELMRNMVLRGDLEELAPERITEETRKLLLLAERPSIGFELMRELGIISRTFPELDVLKSTPQEPDWHPEGDVWIHTMMVVDSAAKLIRQPERGLKNDEPFEIMLGALCHDLGKPPMTRVEDGRIRSRGHEEAGVEPTKAFFSRFVFPERVEQAVLRAVAHHLKPRMLFYARQRNELTDEQYVNAVRRLLKRIQPASWRVLHAVAEADFRGRTLPTADGPDDAGTLMAETIKKQDLETRAAEMLLQGQDLMDLGVPAGPLVGKILEKIEDARDEGTIRTKAEALDLAREIIETT